MKALIGFGLALLTAWAVLVGALIALRPHGGLLREALRILPDTVRLLRRLAADPALPRAVRIRLWLLLAYLAMPIDLIPDVLPLIGYVDDAILVCLVLRSVVRRAGTDAILRHWPGSSDGLAALWRVAGLPGSLPASE